MAQSRVWVLMMSFYFWVIFLRGCFIRRCKILYTKKFLFNHSYWKWNYLGLWGRIGHFVGWRRITIKWWLRSMVTSFGWQILALGDTSNDISYFFLDRMLVQHSQSAVWNLLVAMIRHSWIWKRWFIGGAQIRPVIFRSYFGRIWVIWWSLDVVPSHDLIQTRYLSCDLHKERTG